MPHFWWIGSRVTDFSDSKLPFPVDFAASPLQECETRASVEWRIPAGCSHALVGDIFVCIVSDIFVCRSPIACLDFSRRTETRSIRTCFNWWNPRKARSCRIYFQRPGSMWLTFIQYTCTVCPLLLSLRLMHSATGQFFQSSLQVRPGLPKKNLEDCWCGAISCCYGDGLSWYRTTNIEFVQRFSFLGN